jgi:transposase
MQTPIFVRTLTATERQQLRAGLRSPDAFTVRRCQILLASASGDTPPRIARTLGCTAPSVRNALHAFQAEGLACLKAKSSRPKNARPLLDASYDDRLRDLLHRGPRTCGKPRSTWTLSLLAEVVHERGWAPRVLSIEAIRHAVHRLGVTWRRAKHGITSPDPAYARKKKLATA